MQPNTSLRITVCSLALGAATVAVATALALRAPTPELGPILVLGALFVLAENQVVELPDHADVSISFMLGMAAIIVFYEAGSPLGPMLVGMCGGLYLPHLVERDWRKVLINSSNYGFAMLAAALTFNALAGHVPFEPGPLLLLALPVAIVFSVLNVGMYSLTGLMFFSRFPNVVEIFGPLLPQTYPFSILGVFLGLLYVDYGVAFVPLFVVPILVARQTFASYLALKESQEATVRTLIGALEAKDPYTAGHAERVAGYAQYIGRELNMPPSRLERLRFAALMHDVGKLVVPNHLLNKPGKLTAEEFARVRLHEDVSVEILTRIDFLAPVAPSATSEAAEFAPVADDRGQPIEPHIVAVADAFDAMTSTRSYRRALPQGTAFDELRKNSGKQFHPRVVDALIQAIERRGEEHGAGHEDVVHHTDAPEAGTGSAGLGDLLPGTIEHGTEQGVSS